MNTFSVLTIVLQDFLYPI